MKRPTVDEALRVLEVGRDATWDEIRSAYRDSVRSVHPDINTCLLYTSPSPRDVEESRMPSSA